MITTDCKVEPPIGGCTVDRRWVAPLVLEPILVLVLGKDTFTECAQYFSRVFSKWIRVENGKYLESFSYSTWFRMTSYLPSECLRIIFRSRGLFDSVFGVFR